MTTAPSTHPCPPLTHAPPFFYLLARVDLRVTKLSLENSLGEDILGSNVLKFENGRVFMCFMQELQIQVWAVTSLCFDQSRRSKPFMKIIYSRLAARVKLFFVRPRLQEFLLNAEFESSSNV